MSNLKTNNMKQVIIAILLTSLIGCATPSTPPPSKAPVDTPSTPYPIKVDTTKVVKPSIDSL